MPAGAASSAASEALFAAKLAALSLVLSCDLNFSYHNDIIEVTFLPMRGAKWQGCEWQGRLSGTRLMQVGIPRSPCLHSMMGWLASVLGNVQPAGELGVRGALFCVNTSSALSARTGGESQVPWASAFTVFPWLIVGWCRVLSGLVVEGICLGARPWGNSGKALLRGTCSKDGVGLE